MTDDQAQIDYAAKLLSDGYPARRMPIFALIDLQQGGVERLKAEGFERIITLYTKLDIAFLLGVRGIQEHRN